MRRRHVTGTSEEAASATTSTAVMTSRTRQPAPAPRDAHGHGTVLARPPQPTPEWLEKINDFYLNFMDALPYGVVQFCMPEVAPEKLSCVDELQVDRVVPFSADNTAHMDLLRRLWEGHHRVVFASPELTRFDAALHRSHDQWQAMGFQGLDPSTDFRGAGCFALEQLVYLVEKHPELWSRFLTPDFLLGAAGVNVTMRLMSLLEWSKGANVVDMQHRAVVFSRRRAQCRLVDYVLGADGAADGFAVSEDTPQARMVRLHEVYCTYMTLLHDRWMRSTKNLMEFNAMINDTDYDVVHRLCQHDTIASFQACAATQQS